MALPKPPKVYYSLEEVAGEWEWSVDDLIDYGEQGLLVICREKIATFPKKLKSGTEIQKETYLPEVEPIQPLSVRLYVENYRDRFLILKGLSPDGRISTTGLFVTHEEKTRFEEDHLKIKASDKINPAEKKSLLKMIFAMAVAGYKYDPSTPKSTIQQEISDDAANVDFSIDPDTVRKWLKVASKLDKDGI